MLVSSSLPPLLAGAPGGGDGGLGRVGHTRVLAFKEDLRVVELAEEEDNPFVCDAATVDVCAMAGGTVVQAHAQVGRSVVGWRWFGGSIRGVGRGLGWKVNRRKRGGGVGWRGVG